MNAALTPATITTALRGARVSFVETNGFGHVVAKREGIIHAFSFYFEIITAVYVDVDGGPVGALVWLETQDVRVLG